MDSLVLIFLESIAIYVLVILCLRLLGKKGLAELSVADLVLIVLIGEALGALVPDDNKFLGAIVCIVTLTIVNYVFEHLTFKVKKFRKFIEGTPVILVRNGKVIQRNMKNEKVTIENLQEAIRSNGIKNLEDVELGILETDGEISIIEKQSKK